jgi:arginyl-tRNA synthetase
MIKTKTLEILNSTLKRCGERGLFEIPSGFEIQLEVPRVEAHGDFATNIALNLAKPNKCSPRGQTEQVLAERYRCLFC